MIPETLMTRVLAGGLTLACGCLHAAEQPGGTEGPLEEITVTAQKRSERIQDVPIAISAFSAKSLAEQRIVSPADLTRLVPSLTYTVSSGFQQPFLRGIGTTVNQPNVDPDVATYLDGVYASNTQGQLNSMLGVERVEVLAGPQGTLYGRNAVGGAINIVTLTPGQQAEGALRVGYGNRDRMELAGRLSGPLSETLSAGLYVAGTQVDPFYSNSVPRDARSLPRTPEQETQWGARTKVVFDNADQVRLEFKGEYMEQVARDFMAYQNILPNALGVVLGAPLTLEPVHNTADSAEFNRNHQSLFSLMGTFDLGFADLISLTSRRKVHVDLATDADGTSAPVASQVTVIDSDTYSQELRLQSHEGSRISWVAGAYGFYEDAGSDPNSTLSSVLFAGPFGPGAITTETFGFVRTRSWALFSEVKWPLSDAVNLTLGARFSEDEKRLRAHTQFRRLVNGDYGAPFGVVSFAPREASWSKFTPKITLDYRLGDTMLYATASKGYKSGAWNSVTPAQATPVDPETLNSYEIGSKSDFASGRLRLNTAAYYYKFKDIQTRANDLKTSTTRLRNAAAARAYGFEATLSAVLIEDLVFEGGIAAEHSEYTSFPNLAGFVPAAVGMVGATVDGSGNRLPRQAKLTYTAALTYSHEIGSAGEIQLRTDWYHNSGYFWDEQNILPQRAYGVLNARVGFEAAVGNWEVALWGRNLTDEAYYGNAINTGLSTVVNYTEPRSYGVTVGFKF